MVAEHPVRPARPAGSARLVIGDDLRDRSRIPQRREQREIERQMGAGEVVAVVGDETVQRQIDLADQHAIVELVDHPPHLGDDLVHFRLVGGIVRQDRLRSAAGLRRNADWADCRETRRP